MVLSTLCFAASTTETEPPVSEQMYARELSGRNVVERGRALTVIVPSTLCESTSIPNTARALAEPNRRRDRLLRQIDHAQITRRFVGDEKFGTCGNGDRRGRRGGWRGGGRCGRRSRVRRLRTRGNRRARDRQHQSHI